ncbi:cyclin-P3-1-like isoform X2 [Arachis hypogaea]
MLLLCPPLELLCVSCQVDLHRILIAVSGAFGSLRSGFTWWEPCCRILRQRKNYFRPDWHVFIILKLLKIRYGDCGAGNEDVSSDIYLSLGLKGVGFSRVLSHLSSLLKRSVQRNETQIEAKHVKGCSPSCFVVAHIYVDRFLQHTQVKLTSNVHRLLITSIMVAAKFMDDA